MTKVLKTTSLVLVSILTLLIVAGIILMTCVSPNTFKPLIASQVLKYTGRQLTIDGDLAWSIYPFVGFKVGHMSLSNPPRMSEKVFAEVNNATVGVKLLPLLQGQIATDGIALSGLKLNLIKNTDGSNNWQDLQNLNSSSNAIATNNTTNISHSRKLSVEIPSVDVTDAQISWDDKQSNQFSTISNFQLHAKDIYLNKFFPVKTTFDYASKGNAAGHAVLNGEFKVDQEKQLFAINDLTFSTTMQQGGQKITVDISGNVLAELSQQMLTVKTLKGRITNISEIKSPLDIAGNASVNLGSQTVKIENFSGQLANLNVAGMVTINHYSNQPQISGNLQTKPFDLKKLLQAVGKDFPALQKAQMLTASFNFSAAPTATTSLLSSLILQGQLKLDELQAAKLSASNINVTVNLKDSMLEFTSIKASFYQGSLAGDAKVNLAQAIPQVSLQAKLANVQAEPLLRDLGKQGNKMTIKGAGNIDLQVTSAGLDNDALTRNLNGTLNFAFKNGQLDGVNLGYLLDSAYALVKRQAAPAQGQDVTNFGDLTGSGTIHDGVVTNKDFLLDSPRFSANGEGTIDLVNQKINFNVKASTKDVGANHHDKDALNLYSLAIPVSITGDLDNPSIRINAQTILQEVAEQQMKQIKNKVGDQLKGKLPGKAGDLLQNILAH